MALVHTDDNSQYWAYMGPPPRLKKTRARIVARQRAPKIDAKVPFKKYPDPKPMAIAPAAPEIPAISVFPEPEKKIINISLEDLTAMMVALSSMKEKPKENAGITLRQIMHEIALKYNVTVIDIKSARRTRNVIIPRQEFFYRARMETGHSLPVISKFCGGRDHTTALHGYRKHAERNGLPLEGKDRR